MIFRKKSQEYSTKTLKMCFKAFLCSFFFLLSSLHAFSQDSIPTAQDLTEEKELSFQQYFFKSLSEKSIGNHQKAIENLESCNQILTNDVAVFFEFSKNYLLLNKTLLAKEYIDRALIKKPNNIWMLKHLVEIHLKDSRFSKAIPVQKKVAAINLKEREFLVRMYLQNRNYKEAVSLMNVMEQDNALSSNFKRLKNNLEKRKENTAVLEEKKEVGSLEEQFKTNNTYAILKQILEVSKDKPDVLLKYSNEGVSLFPAQPFVYLMQGRSFNYQKKYKKALLSLQNGIDFVIEDNMEADFYKEMATSYRGLGNFKEEKKFLERSKK